MLFSKKSSPESTILCQEENHTEDLVFLKNRVMDAYAKLDNTTDPVLIDSCIYEINAASLRYEFFLNLAKQRQLI